MHLKTNIHDRLCSNGDAQTYAMTGKEGILDLGCPDKSIWGAYSDINTYQY